MQDPLPPHLEDMLPAPLVRTPDLTSHQQDLLITQLRGQQEAVIRLQETVNQMMQAFQQRDAPMAQAAQPLQAPAPQVPVGQPQPAPLLQPAPLGLDQAQMDPFSVSTLVKLMQQLCIKYKKPSPDTLLTHMDNLVCAAAGPPLHPLHAQLRATYDIMNGKEHYGSKLLAKLFIDNFGTPIQKEFVKKAAEFDKDYAKEQRKLAGYQQPPRQPRKFGHKSPLDPSSLGPAYQKPKQQPGYYAKQKMFNQNPNGQRPVNAWQAVKVCYGCGSNKHFKRDCPFIQYQ